MSGISSPKRPLETDEDEDSQAENHRLELKKHQHDVFARSVSVSRSSSRSSCGRASSVNNLSNDVQKMFVTIESSQQSGLPPLSRIQSSSSYQSLQGSSPSLMVGREAHRSDNWIDEEICFGMLRGVRIKVVGNPKIDPKICKQIETDENMFVYLDLIFGQDRYDIQFDSINIATMNIKTQYALRQLMSYLGERLRYQALVDRKELVEILERAMKPLGDDGSKLEWLMNIQVFGARPIADAVAKELSKYRLFLQHPDPIPFVPYENPQYLGIVASSFVNGAILPRIHIESSEQEIEPSPPIEELVLVSEELKTVINCLPGHEYLREADVDERVKTDLLNHQRTAVNFVLGRESVENKNFNSLWDADNLDYKVPVFRHRITRLTSEIPNDMLGGILADDMGLGKTLTMIASIVTTISRAENFATGEYLHDGRNTNAKISVMSTLVIVPSVLLLKGWIDEIKKHVVPETLKTYTYHGPDRHLVSSSALPYHIVFSTYGTVAADFSRGGGVLNCFHWYRLILDEAHTIRNWTTKSFKAVKNLSANIRWCMTGTPVQNSLHDLRSLIQFLRLPHLDDPTVFQIHIAERKRVGKGIQRSRPDYENLKLLLGSICLRRKISSLSLGITFSHKRPCLSEAERRTYNELAMSCKRSIDALVSDRQSIHGNRAILVALLRLRIFCNTGLASIGVIKNDSVEQFNPDEVNSLLQQSDEVPVCMECGCEILSHNTNGILHEHLRHPRRPLRCEECIQLKDDGRISLQDHLTLPDNVNTQSSLILKEHSESESSSYSAKVITHNFIYPSKLKAVLLDILEHQFQEKSIIFSFWKRSLDLMAQLLRENGIIFGQVDGSLSPGQRQKVLAEFVEDTSVKVLLMTLGTGAAGLNNLSVASRIHILEPQWNPSVEDQAIGRVLRLGQTQQVCVIRYIMSKTIEESVMTRQIAKIQLALAGGIQSLDAKKSSESERVASLQEVGKIIESTVFTEVLTAVPQGQKDGE